MLRAPIQRSIVALFAVAPSVAWACSGPKAAAAIQRAELMGLILAITSIGVAIGFALWLRKRGELRRVHAWALILVVGHPGWWLSARSGDCGNTRIIASWAATGALLMIGFYFFVRAWYREPREPNEP